jgi:hypothetical protein
MQEHTRNTRFYPEVWIHKESYVLVEGFTKNQVSLNPFLSQEVTKTYLVRIHNPDNVRLGDSVVLF